MSAAISTRSTKSSVAMTSVAMAYSSRSSAANNVRSFVCWFARYPSTSARPPTTRSASAWRLDGTREIQLPLFARLPPLVSSAAAMVLAR